MLLGKSGRLGSPEQLFGYQFCAAVGASRCLHVVTVVGVNELILKRPCQARVGRIVLYFTKVSYTIWVFLM